MSIVFDRAVSFYDQTRGLPPQAERDLSGMLREQTTLRSGSRVIEIGVGTGRIALPLAHHNGYRYVGIDLSREMMMRLRARDKAGSVALTQGDISRLPFVDHYADAIVAVHIFHLVDTWQRAMDEAQRVLRPGGWLLHGRSQDGDNQPARQLRLKLNELTGRSDRRSMGRLDWQDVRPELERRFGAPRDVDTAAWQITETPRHVIDQFRARIWSSTWAIDDQTLEQAARRGTDWAIAEYGSLDAPLIRTPRFRWEMYSQRS